MDKLGTVVEILGKKHLLLKLNGNFESGQKLTVFSDISVPALKAKYKLEGLCLPKGEIQIISNQGNGLYLAGSFTTLSSRSLQIPASRSLLEGLISYEESPPSVKLAPPSIPVDLPINYTVEVGDVVGRN